MTTRAEWMAEIEKYELRALVDEAFRVLDDWSGDRVMGEVEKEAFCDLWQKLGDFRGWDRSHPEPTPNPPRTHPEPTPNPPSTTNPSSTCPGDTVAPTDYEYAQHMGITSKDRWSEGTPHDPRSERLFRFIQEHDYKDMGDTFCWKCGGDGDNGETLMFQLDAYFETLDQIEADHR